MASSGLPWRRGHPAGMVTCAGTAPAGADCTALAHGNIMRVLADAKIGHIHGTAPDRPIRRLPIFCGGVE
jgi:hypothetical protein